jgi:hypothetical protein
MQINPLLFFSRAYILQSHHFPGSNSCFLGSWCYILGTLGEILLFDKGVAGGVEIF